MQEWEQELRIPVLREDTRFWMVRTKCDLYYQEFLRENYIAIGWNAVLQNDLNQPDADQPKGELACRIESIYQKERKIGNVLNKCYRFCYGMKPGDIAMIVGETTVTFAEVGEYCEAEGPQYSVHAEQEMDRMLEQYKSKLPQPEMFRCPYAKRRLIRQLRTLRREKQVGPYLQALLARNGHSLSDITEYSQTILGLCYDAYIYQGVFTLAFKVTRKQEIPAVDLAQLVMDTAELISAGHPERVQVRTTLHSPGDVVLQIAQDALALGPALLIYLAVFGGKAGNFEFHSVMTLAKEIRDWKYENRMHELEVEEKEEDVRNKKLQNLRQQVDLEDRLMERSGAVLAETAVRLEVEPTEATLQQIRELMNEKKTG